MEDHIRYELKEQDMENNHTGFYFKGNCLVIVYSDGTEEELTAAETEELFGE